ncbi:hypothetical protein D3C81_2074360 [compost metagenome]
MSGLVYTMSMKIPEGLQVPSNVKDSLDEALLVAEGLTGLASESLKKAGRAAFDKSFFAILVGVSVFFIVASLVISLVGDRSKLRSSDGKN